MRNWFGNDWNWIVAGLAAAIVVPVLSFLAGMPIWIAAIIGLLVFVGLIFALAPKRLFEGLDAKAISRGRLDFARDLLSTAAPAAERLEASAKQIGSKDVARRVRHLAEIAADVFAKVEANPESAGTVRRFLSYYLPRAAEVAEGFAVIEAKRQPDAARLQEVGLVLTKLEDAFVHYSDSLVEDRLDTLDTELRLIQASLKEDIGR
ncbi:5-bromo-4-chloroindolyl phosphate hydrolysis family protein [Rhizobium multihospitium]|uniref:5-bromo-4-chloroindolyl phosphate hydrolysis protein n=1 Tax=Rhizobium multihospitium TaxID=410764 RepID=A0A1C3WMZ9_9HYPH|nr:5-bromo-4-chloroindolyl phosphate hydrolysis family protein [Rhizobium multihospitium]SCB41462.1 5-bromo-4-chloroindolyl phosphate hydrolysis protein [Rhizobium multihospitium]